MPRTPGVGRSPIAIRRNAIPRLSHKTEPPPVVGPTAGRFLGLDQARALAIGAMVVFHFAHGVFAHLPALEPVRAPVLWFGRTATPAFVAVFGLTVGFALLPRYRNGQDGDTARRLRRRSALVLVAAVLVSLPVYARLAATGTVDVWEWLFGSYSVLLFYGVALALLPPWLRFLRRHTVLRAVLAGLGLWVVGSVGYDVWPQGPPSGAEFVRLMLLSGAYGYCQMMGTALLAAPVGLALRQAFDRGGGPGALAGFLAGGVGLSAAGAAWGWAAGEYDLARILGGDLRIPARGWYFLHFGALALVAAAGLELLTRGARWFRPAGYVLALAGQTALVLFTGHAFVLPALELADRVTSLDGTARVAAGFVPFVLFCAIVLYGRHRWLAKRAVALNPGSLGDRSAPPSEAPRTSSTLAPSPFSGSL